jgi:hypothetical protein
MVKAAAAKDAARIGELYRRLVAVSFAFDQAILERFSRRSTTPIILELPRVNCRPASAPARGRLQSGHRACRQLLVADVAHMRTGLA